MDKRHFLVAVGLAALVGVGWWRLGGPTGLPGGDPGPPAVEPVAENAAVPQGMGEPHAGDGLADILYPTDIARLVADAELIVLGEVTEAVDLGTQVLVTAEPVPDDSPASAIPLPGFEAGLVGFTVEATQTILDDGGARPIRYEQYGELPASEADRAANARSEFPQPEAGAESLMFLKRLPDSTSYYLPWGACGRIVVDDSGPSCSDGERTVLPFMRGLSSQELIEAVIAEVGP